MVLSLWIIKGNPMVEMWRKEGENQGSTAGGRLKFVPLWRFQIPNFLLSTKEVFSSFLDRNYFANRRYWESVILLISGLLVKGITELFSVYKELSYLCYKIWFLLPERQVIVYFSDEKTESWRDWNLLKFS